MATVLEITGQSALLILILLVLRPVFKKRLSARFRYALWLLPALRLVIPFSVQSVMSIWNIVQPAISPGPTAAGNSIAQGLPWITVLPASTAVMFPATQTMQSSSPMLNASNVAEAVPLNWIQLLPSIIMAVWVLGSLIAFMLLAVNSIRLARRLQKAEPVTVHGTLPVLLADVLPSPCLTGLLRPRIVVTPEAFASNTLLDMVLLHERTHYKHHDHLWTAARGILLCVWWWNPLVWLAARLSREDCEAACDEAVICHMPPDSRRQYGMSLIALLHKNPSAQSLMQTTTAMQGSKRAMKERIVMIANWKRKGRTLTVCIALCAILLVPVLCTSAIGQAAQTARPKETVAPSPTVTPPETGAPFLTVAPSPSVTPPETGAPFLTVAPSTAGAAQDQMAKEQPQTFSLEKAGAYRENEFLFAGSNGSPPYGTAFLLCTDENGQIKWAVQEDNVFSDMSRFRAAIPYEDDKYVAMRTISSLNNTYKSVVSLIQNGSIVSQIERPYVIDGLFPAEQGFLEISGLFSNWVTIRKVDFEKGLIWQKSYHEDWFFAEVVTVSDGYIAIGRCTGDPTDADSTVGVVVKLNRNGDIVWKHYNTQKSVFTSGVGVSDNSVVLAGNAFVAQNTPAKDAKGYSFIAMYDENGLVWQTDYPYGEGKYGQIQSIIQVDNGFLAAYKESGSSDIRLLLIDGQGKLLKEWNETLGDAANPFPYALHHLPGGIYLTAGGDDPEGKPLTVLKKINLPSNEKPDEGGTVAQLTIRETDSWTVAQRPQTEPYRGTPDDAIGQLITKWNDQYKGTDFWNLDKSAWEGMFGIHGLPGENTITHLEAIHVLLEYIRQTYPDISLDDLKDYQPHLAFRVDMGSPQWQITLIPPDVEKYYGFTGYIYAETGEVSYVVYGPGNG